MKFRNIEAERSRAGMTQVELCRLIGVSVKTLNNYVNGRTPIPSNVLLCMCKVFGCSADYILGRT